MGSIVEGVKTLNSAIRTALLAALVLVLSSAGYYGYNEYTKRDRLLRDQEAKIKATEEQLVTLQGALDTKVAIIDELNVDLKEKAAQIERLETAMHLLKTDQRLAQLRVISIERDEDDDAVTSELEFVELSPAGEPLSEPKRFKLPGDVVYIDNWIVKFDDTYIERGDIQKGTSLCLFRRIFSEEQIPNEGYSLDKVGMRPQAYARGGSLTDFEKKLWSEFWEFANDPKKAAELGVRAANGEAVAIKVREGKAYNITLRSSGGLSIEPVEATDGGSK